MDRMPGGGAPDGAFERFLTAALATIITIMFSWRLLQDENEASGANERRHGGAEMDWASIPQSTDAEYHRQARSRYQKYERERSSTQTTPAAKPPRPPLGGQYDISLDELDIDEGIDSYESRVNNVNNSVQSVLSSQPSPISVQETVTYDRFDPVKDQPLGAQPPSTQIVDSLSQLHDSSRDPPVDTGEETLTTWDDYNWQEETGTEQDFVIKTRRSGRDFAKSKQNSLQSINNSWSALAKKSEESKQSITNDQSASTNESQRETQTGVSSTTSPYLSFSQRLASFEYSDTGGDSGYVDLYPDVDTDESGESESSDEEHEYEIQVSDSDSDSSDERGTGSFYGISSLDTIFEEYESDIEEERERFSNCDKDGVVREMQGHDHDKGYKGDKGQVTDAIGAYVPHIPVDREASIGNTRFAGDKTDVKQTELPLNQTLNTAKRVDPVIDSNLKMSGQVISETMHPPTSGKEFQVPVSYVETATSPFLSKQGSLEKGPEEGKETKYPLHPADRTLLSHVETTEYNSSPPSLNAVDDLNHILTHTALIDSEPDRSITPNNDSTDCDVNKVGPLNSGISHQNASQVKSVTGHGLSNINRQAPVADSGATQRDTGINNNKTTLQSDEPVSAFQIEFSKLQEKMKAARIGQLQKDSTSETPEDSSPSSPVRDSIRHVVPDNSAVEDRFSDTESCSSESVITVISVRSTESDGGCPDEERRDVTRDTCVTPVLTSVDVTDIASGGESSDQLTRLNMSDSSYEHNSLVSGFLNDSLNSLLSANNVNEMESESDLEEISELERTNSSLNDETADSIDESKVSISEISHSNDDTAGGDQSECSSKTSSADSLSIVLARVQETNQINTELSNQAASKVTDTTADEFRIESRVSSGLKSRDIRIIENDDVVDVDDVTDRYVGSDSSSDSSDPPLREYDPDDDDLAAFQFNQDVDNDSFYLLVGDEGSLRNYETFTNLNSVGLSSEYNDAIASLAFPDEARGFKFSRTEDLGTEFRTHGYFTERRTSSDLDSPVDKGLSPITSEDEGITCLPETEIDPFPRIPLQSEQMEQVRSEPPMNQSSHLDKYKDAELSSVNAIQGTSNGSLDASDQKSIDFQKYIIQPERKTDAIKLSDQETAPFADPQISDKDSAKIDKEFTETKESVIDNDQCAIGRSSVNSVNNTSGTNFTSKDRMPEGYPTETSPDTLLFGVERDASENETDLDQYLCTDNDPIRDDESELEESSVKERLNRLKKDSNCDKDKFRSNGNSRERSGVNDVDLVKSPVKIETNIDDLFIDNELNTNSKDSVVTKGSTGKTQNTTPRETCIDDIYFDNGSLLDQQLSESTFSTTSPSSSRVETYVDDIFDEPISDNSGDVRNKARETNIYDIWSEPSTSHATSRGTVDVTSSRSKVETNIDDVCKPVSSSAPVDVTKTRRKVETNIDDIFDEDATPRAPVNEKQPRIKIETNIDDIFDDVVPVKVAPVQSTPLKHTHAVETNIDDIFEDIAPVNANIKSEHKNTVETFVDDLFDDVGLAESEAARSRQVTDEGKAKVIDKLSYETFVDDLFSDVLSKNNGSNVQSGPHRAINPVGRSSSVKDSRTNIGPPLSVQNVDDVLPTLSAKQQHSPSERSSSYTNPAPQIEREKETIETNDPERDYNVGLQPIPSTDNTRGDVDIDNDCLNLNPSMSEVECQNTRSIPKESSSAKIRHREIGLSDKIEPQICANSTHTVYTKPISYRQDKNGREETIIEGVDTISPESRIENTESQLESESDQNKAIYDSSNNANVSPDSNYNYLNRQKHRDIDYNANVSLPKSGGLNIHSNSDNRTATGQSPTEHNRAPTTHPVSEGHANIRSGSLEEVEEIVDTLHEQYGLTNANDIVLKIVEEDSNREPDARFSSVDQDTYSSTGSCSFHSDDDSLSSIEESYHSLQNSYSSARHRGLSDSAIGRVVRSPVVKPSAIFGKSKEYQGVKRRVHKHQLKKYTSILQQPVTLDSQQHGHQLDTSPEKPISVTRLKVLQSRQRFLSAENLSNSSFEDRFLQYRTSLTSTTPRKYLKRHERSLVEHQSTESLPTNMSVMEFMHSGYGDYNSSMDRIHSLPVSRQIDDLYNSRYSSANSSFERREYDKLHANCMFSPEKREEIKHTTKSLENMFEQLLRYGSVSSLATETDLDAPAPPRPSQSGSFPPDIDITDYISFQYPLERAASMSALTGSSEGHRLPRKPGKGRFASRNVPKSKSLQTLETNLDDVFASEDEFAGELKKTPSVHELRVSKSLSKLHVPDWFRKSSFSRSGSTQSLFTYSSRQGSTSTLGSSIYPCSITTSPSPSVTPGSQTVIIYKRVTASPITPTSTAKLLRAPLLPVTPERSPIHNTPPVTGLPSDRFRTNDKKELKPIAIVPFAKLREMFEKKSQQDAQSNASKSPVTSPTEEKPPPKVRFEPATPIRPETSSASMQSSRKETAIDFEPVQNKNNRTVSPAPAIPDRKPILADTSRRSESTPSNAQPTRRMQVHFSDEKKPPVEHVSNSNAQEQRQNANNVRHNGSTAPSTNASNKDSIESKEKPSVKKPSGFRASLPLPQFRFRRPGVFASKSSSSSSSTAQQSANTQNKKGKNFDSRFHNENMHARNDLRDFNCNNDTSVRCIGNHEQNAVINDNVEQSDFIDYNEQHEHMSYKNTRCGIIGNNEHVTGSNLKHGVVGQTGKRVWLHVLESKTKIDGETLFEFLQKRRYSSILENGFAEQLEELQDRDVAFNFPVVSLGNHPGGDRRFPTSAGERSPDLQVVLTNAYSNHSAPYDYVNNKLRNDASMDDILDGLLLLDGHSTGRLRMDENGRIVPKYPEDSPDTPPGFTMNSGNPNRDMYKDGIDNSICDVPDSEYVLVKCENAECKRETNLREARLYFKSCHSCFTYYCSRQCRKDDWDHHKKACIYSRINSACKHVIKCINRQPVFQYQCSRIARRGYLAQGRGCVMFAFPDISSSEDFLFYGFESLWVPPVYVSLRELPNASMLGSKLEVLTETCMNYNPELKYVIHVAIVIPPKLPVRPIPRRIESIIQKSAKLRLSPAHMHPRQETSTADETPSTLILTAVPGNQHAFDVDGQKTRELCFINIQRKLRQRGVSLRHQFSDVYNKLIDFVSDAKHFSPLIIYPTDGRTGRKFMCVIMPESEPEIEWIRDPNLFHELDVFEEEEVTSSQQNLSPTLREVLL